jgi:selenocysteine lyase/cysteine desulfurase
LRVALSVRHGEADVERLLEALAQALAAERHGIDGEAGAP